MNGEVDVRLGPHAVNYVAFFAPVPAGPNHLMLPALMGS